MTALTLLIVISGQTPSGALAQTPNTTASTRGENDRQLLQYLDELRLNRLSLALLERQYARQTDSSLRVELGKQLAVRYQQAMLAKGQRNEIGQLIQKVESLLRDFGQLDTPPLRLALSHASFLQIEDRFFDWWREGAAPEESRLLSSDLEQTKSELARQQRISNQQRNDLIAVLPLSSDSSLIEQSKISELEARLVHIDFLIAWCHYFHAVAVPIPDDDLLKQSHEHFLASLHLEPVASIDNLKIKWIDFDTSFSNRALLGLALVYAAQDLSLIHI